MKQDTRMRVTVGAIDEDGEFSNVYAGMCTRARCMEIMQDILDEDGLPILEVFGKHEKFGEELPKVVKSEKLTEEQKKENEESRSGFTPLSIPVPVIITLKVGSVELSVTGEEEKILKAIEKMAPMMLKINKSMQPKLNEVTGLLAGLAVPAK